MNLISRLITGIFIIVFGFFVLVETFSESAWVALLFGGAFIVLGFFILFNKNEDKIEEIK